MVASIDGATAVEGRSGGLGGPADKEVFRALRGMADAIVVAAGTVRAETYGPPRTSPEIQAHRTAIGQRPHPRIAIVSGSLDLDPTAPLFVEAPDPPLILTVDDPSPDRVEALSGLAELVGCGAERVDLGRAGTALAAAGIRRAVVEGGPALNGQLVLEGMVDEVNLTISPLLVAGDSARVAEGAEAAVPPQGMVLAHLWEADELLFARYVSAAWARSTS